MPYLLLAIATPTPQGERRGEERRGEGEGNSAQFALPIQLFNCVMGLKGTFEFSLSAGRATISPISFHILLGGPQTLPFTHVLLSK